MTVTQQKELKKIVYLYFWILSVMKVPVVKAWNESKKW